VLKRSASFGSYLKRSLSMRKRELAELHKQRFDAIGLIQICFVMLVLLWICFTVSLYVQGTPNYPTPFDPELIHSSRWKLMEVVRDYGRSLVYMPYTWHIVNSEWPRFHGEIVASLEDPVYWPEASGRGRSESMRVLVVSAVGDTPELAENWNDIFAKLGSNEQGDSFHFHFFHYTATNEAWKKMPWYSDEALVTSTLQTGCKVDFWKTLDEGISDEYEYVWFLDDDLDFTFFHWGIFRSLLRRFNPVVSTPSIVPVEFGERSSDFDFMRMQSESFRGQAMLAHAAPATEMMAPVISTKIWSALYKRITVQNGRSDWGIDGWWSKLARLAKTYCNAEVGNLVVDVTPLVHLDSHNIDGGVRRQPGRVWNLWNYFVDDHQLCKRQCLGNNCEPFTANDVRNGMQVLENAYGACSDVEWTDMQGGLIRNGMGPIALSGAHTKPKFEPQKLSLSSFKDYTPRGIYGRFKHKFEDTKEGEAAASGALDMVYAITMPERKEYIEEALQELGVRTKVLNAVVVEELTEDDYIALSDTFTKGAHKQIYGRKTILPVSLSFFMCYYDAYVNGYSTIMVVEDDAMVTVEVEKVLATFNEFKDQDCTVLFLGYCYADCRQLQKSVARVSDNLMQYETHKGITPLCNHALVMKSDFVKGYMERSDATFWKEPTDHDLMRYLVERKEKVCVPPKAFMGQNRKEFGESNNENQHVPENWHNRYENGIKPMHGDFGCLLEPAKHK